MDHLNRDGMVTEAKSQRYPALFYNNTFFNWLSLPISPQPVLFVFAKIRDGIVIDTCWVYHSEPGGFSGKLLLAQWEALLWVEVCEIKKLYALRKSETFAAAAQGRAYVHMKTTAFRMVKARQRTLSSAEQGHSHLNMQCQHVFNKISFTMF